MSSCQPASQPASQHSTLMEGIGLVGIVSNSNTLLCSAPPLRLPTPYVNFPQPWCNAQDLLSFLQNHTFTPGRQDQSVARRKINTARREAKKWKKQNCLQWLTWKSSAAMLNWLMEGILRRIHLHYPPFRSPTVKKKETRVIYKAGKYQLKY